MQALAGVCTGRMSLLYRAVYIDKILAVKVSLYRNPEIRLAKIDLRMTSEKQFTHKFKYLREQEEDLLEVQDRVSYRFSKYLRTRLT